MTSHSAPVSAWTTSPQRVVGPMAPLSAKSILEDLASPVHLSRDRALLGIAKLPESEVEIICHPLVGRLDPDGPWEVTTSALQASSVILKMSETSSECIDSFSRAALLKTLPLITHREPRVRSATSALIGDVARVLGATVWDETSEVLMGNVERNFSLDNEQRLREADRVAKSDLQGAETSPKDRGLRMVHETEGWRGLETSLLAISEVISGCGERLLLRSKSDLEEAAGVETVIDYIGRAKAHPNRYVREAGLRLLASVLDACVAAGTVDLLLKVGNKLLVVVAEGLQDNWSQVRHSASVAVRKLMAGVPAEERRQFYSVLLPRMCLNRHYVAEGVKSYSQETWRTVIGEDGKVYLVKFFDHVVAFYESQCNADNHAVREAACQSFAECTTRLDSATVKPFVPRIVNALIECFKDESWPVRDYACTALAAVTAHFGPEVEHSGRLRELFDLFYAHLSDNIVSVRENSAVSFVKAARAFPIEHPVLGLGKLAECAVPLYPRVASQTERKFGSAHDGCDHGRDRDTGYGAAAKLARDNDVELHTGQVMYSCGSLAPKLRRGGGCMDHGFSRPKEPWEETDGGIRLWARIAEAGGQGSDLAGKALPAVLSALEVVTMKEFAHSGQALESFWNAIALGAGHVPKDSWTPELLVKAAGLADNTSRSEHARSATAARAAMTAMRRAVGFQAYVEASRTASKMRGCPGGPCTGPMSCRNDFPRI